MNPPINNISLFKKNFFFLRFFWGGGVAIHVGYEERTLQEKNITGVSGYIYFFSFMIATFLISPHESSQIAFYCLYYIFLVTKLLN